MSITLPIETAERDLRGLIEEMNLGDTVTLVGSEGTPQALLVSLRPGGAASVASQDWQARWDSLAQRVSQAWRGDKDALETVSEMRR
jgi:hypothetical protein